MGEDKFKIDGDKILYHPDRIKKWLEGSKTVYPIYIEISPMGACNHRCTFCAVDYIGYQKRSLDKDVLIPILTEMGQLGVKSIMYAGEGEPLLHKDLAEIIKHTKNCGIDVAITTNATPLTEKFAKEALPYITWIKASINAGTAETYALIHQTKEQDFERVWKNMANATKIREEYGLNHTNHSLGAQMVLLPENARDAVTFASRAKESGLDYAVIKPYSQHKKSITKKYDGLDYDEYMNMAEELEKLNSENFEVIFRSNTMGELKKERHEYPKCQATPHFWAYIMANGELYGCSAYLNDERFCYGSINEQSFREIWMGEKRLENINYVNEELNIEECRKNCRMHHVNNTLWKLKNGMEIPDELHLEQLSHKNFI